MFSLNLMFSETFVAKIRNEFKSLFVLCSYCMKSTTEKELDKVLVLKRSNKRAVREIRRAHK